MDNGIRTQRSSLSFDETISRLKEGIAARKIKLFCEIDHAAEAAAVGLTMPRTTVLIFGNARAGTPVMLEAPSAALDLPLKLLVAETSEGAVLISWNEAERLGERHGFGGDLATALRAPERLAEEVSRT